PPRCPFPGAGAGCDPASRRTLGHPSECRGGGGRRSRQLVSRDKSVLQTRKGLPMSTPPTDVPRFDGVRVPAGDYRPVWLESLADDVTIEGSAMNGVVHGADAVRSIVTYIRTLYDSQELNYAGPYGEDGFPEVYTPLMPRELWGDVVQVTRNAAQDQQVGASYP